MRGFLSVLKPPGITSHSAVQAIRSLTGIKRVGHAGTLDPAAAGVLPMALGPDTRLLEYVDQGIKSYRAEMLLGMETSTQDLQGEVIRIRDVSSLTREAVEITLKEFVGGYIQIPPMFSAVHHGGKRLYQLAREGVEVERPGRWVDISAIKLLRITISPPFERVLMDVTCSRGTYIRSLCVDIGARLGCGACLAFLVRQAVGSFNLSTSYTLEELTEAGRDGRLNDVLLPSDFPLVRFPGATVSTPLVSRVLHGNSIPIRAVEWNQPQPEVGSLVRVYGPDKALLAIAELDSPFILKMRKVLVQGEEEYAGNKPAR